MLSANLAKLAGEALAATRNRWSIGGTHETPRKALRSHDAGPSER